MKTTQCKAVIVLFLKKKKTKPSKLPKINYLKLRGDKVFRSVNF